MNLDHFLNFWSQYNQTIIQALIVVTLIFIVALVFITLFGSKDEEPAGGAQVGLSPELEKSLQKMLENQTKAAVFDFSKGQDGSAAPSSIAKQPGAISPDAVAHFEKFKVEMAAKEKKIEELSAQLAAQAKVEPKAESSDASALEGRIKELEARLAEYDIISEDIADLSRYKDENERIKLELAALKGESPATPQPVVAAVPPQMAEPVAEPVVAPPEVPVVEPAAIAETATAPALQVVSSETAPADEVAVAAAAAPEADPAVSAAIDDDLMKEFAAAVEVQKSTQTSVPAPNPDSEDLMGQFENFVQKKEGS